MTKQDHITYWLTEAEDSWESAEVLFKARKYAMAAFCYHLCFEKLLKGTWVKNNEENFPPRIHNLIYLHDGAKLNLAQDLTDLFIIVNTWNMEGRYPEYKQKLHRTITKSYLEDKKEGILNLKICLLNLLH